MNSKFQKSLLPVLRYPFSLVKSFDFKLPSIALAAVLVITVGLLGDAVIVDIRICVIFFSTPSIIEYTAICDICKGITELRKSVANIFINLILFTLSGIGNGEIFGLRILLNNHVLSVFIVTLLLSLYVNIKFANKPAGFLIGFLNIAHTNSFSPCLNLSLTIVILFAILPQPPNKPVSRPLTIFEGLICKLFNITIQYLSQEINISALVKLLILSIINVFLK